MTDKQLGDLNVKLAKKLGWTSFRLERTPFETKRMTGVAPCNFRHQFVPTFTSNLAYAMKLVDWANEHKYKFTLTRTYLGSAYEAHFTDYKFNDYIGWGVIPSMAISDAFSKIKE